MTSILFEDIFEVKAINKDGVHFDRGNSRNLCYHNFVVMTIHSEKFLKPTTFVLCEFSFAVGLYE
jgi:hypothetical protein